MKSGEPPTCAFCRTALPRSDEEILTWAHKRVELKDPVAMVSLAMNYGRGDRGLSVDHAKCIELLRESAGLGFPGAQYHLGSFHRQGGMGLEKNEETALKYWEKAAEGGHLVARHNLGSTDDANGDHVAAMRYWRLSA